MTPREYLNTRAEEETQVSNTTLVILVNTCMHVAYKHVCVLQWCSAFSQRVQLVDSLVLMGPLQVQLDFLHQGNTISLGDVQFLCSVDAILLMSMNKRAIH